MKRTADSDRAPEVLLGTQGWRCGAWVGPFYPHGTQTRQMLSLYARAFRTVEVDSSAYAVPAAPVVQEWKAQVPADFKFALRVPQEITHERRLQDTDRVLRRFLDRISLLEDHTGPLLLQMPAGFRPSEANVELLRPFLAGLPSGFQWAVEFRHVGWMAPAMSELLRGFGVALVLTESRWLPRKMMPELALEPTAEFGYIRWEGSGGRFKDFSRPQAEREAEFTLWAQVVRTLLERVSVVYGYFSDHFQGHAPHSVREFQRRIGQEPVSPAALQEQPELF